MGPLIFMKDFTLLRRRVQLALGISILRVEPVEGEVIPDGLPQLRSHELWEIWQKVREHRQAQWAARQKWAHK